MKILGSIDIFISHAWRNHDEWIEIVNIVNSIEGLNWRNFSVPWYDPALRPQTDIGKKYIYNTLKTQIIPCQVCFIISELYKLKGNRIWLDLAVEYATEANVPIYYIGNENFFLEWDESQQLYPINVESLGNIINDNLR